MKDAPLVPNLRSVVGAASLVCSESKKSGQEGLTETVDKNNDFTVSKHQLHLLHFT